MGFTALDYGVLFAYLAATAALGAWLGRGQKNLRDYFLGGRNLPWWAVCLSIVATETSTLTFIGAPAIAYTGDLTFLQVAIGYVFGRLLVSLLLIPPYFRGAIETAYEVLLRLGRRVHNFSALLFQVNRALADGVRLFATALVLSVATGISDLGTIAIIGAITVVYTLYGGLVAVVWNDAVQLVIYVGGALVAAWLILEGVPGGWPEVVSLAAAEQKLRVLNFSWDWSQPYTLAGGVVGGAFLTFATHGTDQMMVQRYLACRTQRDGQLALVVSGFLVVGQFLLFLMIGVLLYAFYQLHPPAEPLAQADRVFPMFIVDHVPPGLTGLIIAAIFAAAMSTLSSSLNSLASSTVNDFYRPYLKPEASDAHYLWASRLFTLAWGLVLAGISLLARNWGGVLEVGLTITSIVMGSILGIFLLNLTPRRLPEAVGLASMLAGLVTVLAIHLSGLGVAWTWYVLIGTAVTFAVGMLGSTGPVRDR